jgi:Flp pilus assembly protein TadG
MARSLHGCRRRHGSLLPLFALLTVPLLGVLAFAIDIGYITWVATDLQTAADAAALAGAEKLQVLYVQYTLPNQMHKNDILSFATTNSANSPMATAEAFSSYNRAGNVPITMRDEDVTFGFTSVDGTYHSNYGNYNGGFPNSITVVARRDNTKNTPVSLFFGPLVGIPAKNLTASATATIYSGDVHSLQVIPGVNAHILPVALDMNVWQNFYTTGLSADGTQHVAANGYPQLQVYPVDPNTPGSFGLLDTGPPTKQMPAFHNWIDDGDTPNDMSYLINHGMVPVSVDSPNNWKRGPTLKSTLLSNFQSQLGVPNLLPLFIPASAPAGWQAQSAGSYSAPSGTSPTATYLIAGFAGVHISQANQDDGSMEISIQPCAVIDPTALLPNAKPAGTQISQFGSQTIISTFISAKLTR